MRCPKILIAALAIGSCASEPARPTARTQTIPAEEIDAAPAIDVATSDPLVSGWTTLAERLRALPPDPAPPTITNDTHYWASNERRADLFRPDVDGIGGVYVGVGTDQTYTIAGWQAPDLVVVIDFDQDVVDLHAVYGAFFQAADDSEQMLALWEESGRTRAAALLADSPDLVELYDRARPEVARRLRDLRTRQAELKVASWLTDADQYARVAAVHREGRVVALRGDFTADGVVRRVGEQLEESGATVRVLYLSNIEQYLTYQRNFRANVFAFPFDETSLVLRTLPGRPAGFQYILQTGEDFQTWLRARNVWTVYRLRGFDRAEPLEAAQRHFIRALPTATGE